MTGRASRPDFSIVVPIAPGRRPLVVASLGRLAFPMGRCEVVTQVGPNPSRNRNLGIDRARADIFAFTDDDCQVAPDWLTKAAAFFAAHPDYDAVGGPQLNPPGQGLRARAGGYALSSWFGTYRVSRRYRRARRRLRASQFDLTSANLFITRRAFATWGPFDERLWPNEETALLRRIEQAGGRIGYDPQIVVYHKRRESLRALARQCFGYGRGRARQSRLEGTLLPAIPLAACAGVLLYLALLPLVAPRWPAALLPLAAYAATSLAVSATTALARADPAAAAVLPFAFLAIHTAYPAGFLLEWARPLVASPPEAPAIDAAATP